MGFRHDVYISYRGEDSRDGIVNHLEASLHWRGFETCSYDHGDLEAASDDIDLELVGAIEKSKVFLIIFSAQFVPSPRNLEELAKINEQRNKYGKLVVPIYFSVDPWVIQKQSKECAEAFAQHEKRFSLEKVEAWRVALEETVRLTRWSLRDMRDEAVLIDEILKEVENTLWRTSRTKAGIEWTVVCVNFILEIPSVVFDQLSSAQKPLYVLVCMLISLLSILVCVADLIHRGQAERVRWRWSWPIPWFYYPPPMSKRFGNFADTVGLVCGLCQCSVTIINYSFIHHGADSPIKISIWPMLFATGVLCSKFMERPQRRAVRR